MPDIHRRKRASLGQIIMPLIGGVGAFGTAFTMAFYQLARSNRPHELTWAPVVTLIQACAVALIGLGALRLLRTLRARHEVRVTPWHWVLAWVVPAVSAASLLFFLAAAGTAIEVLRG